jgi:group I intron endonuclease
MNNDTGIYTITSPSGNFYVGSAVSFKKRWRIHLLHLRRGTHHSKPLQNAFNKYGESGMRFDKVALCPVTDLIAIEQRFIDALSPRYNVAPRAGSVLGMKRAPFSAEHRAAISAAHKGMKHAPRSAEVRAKMAEARRGKKFTPEQREACRVWQLGKTINDTQRAALAAETAKRSRRVRCIESGAEFESVHAVKRWLHENGHPKADNGSISRCCRGVLKRVYGYTWEFVARNTVCPEMFEEAA